MALGCRRGNERAAPSVVPRMKTKTKTKAGGLSVSGL
jgi:hypothetical protein